MERLHKMAKPMAFAAQWEKSLMSRINFIRYPDPYKLKDIYDKIVSEVGENNDSEVFIGRLVKEFYPEKFRQLEQLEQMATQGTAGKSQDDQPRGKEDQTPELQKGLDIDPKEVGRAALRKRLESNDDDSDGPNDTSSAEDASKALFESDDDESEPWEEPEDDGKSLFDPNTMLESGNAPGADEQGLPHSDEELERHASNATSAQLRRYIEKTDVDPRAKKAAEEELQRREDDDMGFGSLSDEELMALARDYVADEEHHDTAVSQALLEEVRGRGNQAHAGKTSLVELQRLLADDLEDDGEDSEDGGESEFSKGLDKTGLMLVPVTDLRGRVIRRWKRVHFAKRDAEKTAPINPYGKGNANESLRDERASRSSGLAVDFHDDFDDNYRTHHHAAAAFAQDLAAMLGTELYGSEYGKKFDADGKIVTGRGSWYIETSDGLAIRVSDHDLPFTHKANHREHTDIEVVFERRTVSRHPIFAERGEAEEMKRGSPERKAALADIDRRLVEMGQNPQLIADLYRRVMEAPPVEAVGTKTSSGITMTQTLYDMAMEVRNQRETLVTAAYDRLRSGKKINPPLAKKIAEQSLKQEKAHYEVVMHVRKGRDKLLKLMRAARKPNIAKAISLLKDLEMSKAFTGIVHQDEEGSYFIEKATALPIGTERKWKDGRTYRKTADGWKPVSTQKSKSVESHFNEYLQALGAGKPKGEEYRRADGSYGYAQSGVPAWAKIVGEYVEEEMKRRGYTPQNTYSAATGSYYLTFTHPEYQSYEVRVADHMGRGSSDLDFRSFSDAIKWAEKYQGNKLQDISDELTLELPRTELQRKFERDKAYKHPWTGKMFRPVGEVEQHRNAKGAPIAKIKAVFVKEEYKPHPAELRDPQSSHYKTESKELEKGRKGFAPGTIRVYGGIKKIKTSNPEKPWVPIEPRKKGRPKKSENPEIGIADISLDALRKLQKKMDSGLFPVEDLLQTAKREREKLEEFARAVSTGELTKENLSDMANSMSVISKQIRRNIRTGNIIAATILAEGIGIKKFNVALKKMESEMIRLFDAKPAMLKFQNNWQSMNPQEQRELMDEIASSLGTDPAKMHKPNKIFINNNGQLTVQFEADEIPETDDRFSYGWGYYDLDRVPEGIRMPFEIPQLQSLKKTMLESGGYKSVRSASSWFNKNFGKTWNALHDGKAENAIAINIAKYYQNHGYTKINDGLRGLKGETINSRLEGFFNSNTKSGKIKINHFKKDGLIRDDVGAGDGHALHLPVYQAAELMNNLMGKLTMPSAVLLYRGFGGKEAFNMLMKMNIGEIYRDDGFVSTTINKDKSFGGQVKMQIEVPKGMKCLPLYLTDVMKHEEEVLLPAGTKFKILSKWEENGVVHVRVRALKKTKFEGKTIREGVTQERMQPVISQGAKSKVQTGSNQTFHFPEEGTQQYVGVEVDFEPQRLIEDQDGSERIMQAFSVGEKGGNYFMSNTNQDMILVEKSSDHPNMKGNPKLAYAKTPDEAVEYAIAFGEKLPVDEPFDQKPGKATWGKVKTKEYGNVNINMEIIDGKPEYSFNVTKYIKVWIKPAAPPDEDKLAVTTSFGRTTQIAVNGSTNNPETNILPQLEVFVKDFAKNVKMVGLTKMKEY